MANIESVNVECVDEGERSPVSRVILVTGPARSGKSEWAEQLASQSAKSVIYIATAHMDDQDAEWQARIARHQARRPAEWTTQAVPVELSGAIRQASRETCLLIDSLGTWLANRLDLDETAWLAELRDLLDALQDSDADIILVAEETGWGVVPAYPIGRVFRDRLGTLVRHIGRLADPVYLVTGGYALNLRQLGTPLPADF